MALRLHILLWIGLGTSCLGAVPTVEIAPGVAMPMLALGAANISFTECTVQEGVEQWLRLGGRHIDTANDYGTQLAVGRALKAVGLPRDSVFITTKIPGPIGEQAAIALIQQASLPQLGVDFIDLVLIHFPCLDMHDFPDRCGGKGKTERLATWKGLMTLQKAGKIRAVGVSNYNIEQVAEIIAVGGRPAVNQVEWHLGYHNEILLTAMKASGVTLEAWGSLSGPTATVAGHPGISLRDPRLEKLAEIYNVSTAQLALRWSAHKGVVPVTATCNKDHALGDLATFDVDITASDIAQLDALDADPPQLII